MLYTGWSYGQLAELPADLEPLVYAHVVAAKKAAMKMKR